MLRKIDSGELRLGMYVSSLDRPWVETAFLFQGLKLERLEDIQYLQERCAYVYVDDERSDLQSSAPRSRLYRKPRDPVSVLREQYGEPVVYEDKHSAEDELRTARPLYQSALNLIGELWARIDAGQPLPLSEARQVAEGVVESVLRNPDAFMWLRLLRSSDNYTYRHAVDSCSLAAAFGRQIGLPRKVLGEVALGALLMDIGKTRVAHELLQRRGPLDEAEMEQLRGHVQYGLELIHKSGKVPEVTLEMVRTHHERFNGEGYPRGLAGAQIPVVGRMAAIVDCYDAITSDRPYQKAVTPHEAVRLMYEWRNVDFQEELIEQFIQCLGVYPTGSLVELNSGEVGIVYAQNRVRRLRPKIMLVLGRDKQPLDFAPTVDLLSEAEKEDGMKLAIVRAVDPGEFDIDLADYYL